MKTCQNCNEKLEENSQSCSNCGKAYSKVEQNESFKKELVGIKGWLILVGFGVLISPLRLFFVLSQVYPPLFQEITWQQLFLPSSEAYNFAFTILLLSETIFNFLMIIASLYLIYLFFTKKTSFPKLYIAILAVSIIFVPIDALLVSWVFPEVEAFDNDTVKELTRSIISGAIWIPYMLISERVKATFTN